MLKLKPRSAASAIAEKPSFTGNLQWAVESGQWTVKTGYGLSLTDP
jgi:hypothetical protein